MPTDWICVTAGATSTCSVIATTTAGAYTGANIQEWLFVVGVFVFILGYTLWPRIFRPVKKLND